MARAEVTIKFTVDGVEQDDLDNAVDYLLERSGDIQNAFGDVMNRVADAHGGPPEHEGVHAERVRRA